MPLNTPETQSEKTVIQTLYVNGFGIGLGNCDVSLMLQTNGKSHLLVNLSYTVAKTLGQELVKTIGQLEEFTGRPIMTSPEILAHLEKSDKAGKANELR